MALTIGKIVTYKLSADDAEQVNRRRTNGGEIAERIRTEHWHLGAQAHIGNHASEGDALPMIICRVWKDEFGTGVDGYNGQVFLDGNDTLWVTSVKEGTESGQFLSGEQTAASWPVPVESIGGSEQG